MLNFYLYSAFFLHSSHTFQLLANRPYLIDKQKCGGIGVEKPVRVSERYIKTKFIKLGQKEPRKKSKILRMRREGSKH
jgi:hypothetical protein